VSEEDCRWRNGNRVHKRGMRMREGGNINRDCFERAMRMREM
jgi:hypothetical protein